MARNSIGKDGLAFSANQAVETLGRNIQVARKRRAWTLEEMTGSMFVTRKTLSRLEAGDSSVGLSILVAALHVLGMGDDLQMVATPGKDTVGIFSERQRLPQRVRKKHTDKDEMDF